MPPIIIEDLLWLTNDPTFEKKMNLTKLLLQKCHFHTAVRYYRNASQSTLMEQMKKVRRNMTNGDRWSRQSVELKARNTLFIQASLQQLALTSGRTLRSPPSYSRLTVEDSGGRWTISCQLGIIFHVLLIRTCAWFLFFLWFHKSALTFIHCCTTTSCWSCVQLQSDSYGITLSLVE